jgi:hypothetical protein
MSRLLSKSEQEDILRSKIGLSLDNFSLAWRVAELLIEYREGGLPPPQALVRLRGAGRSVEISGQSCGFFTTPVIQMAILDSRRALDFFGITRDSKSDLLKPITRRRDDDLGIEHFGLPLVSPQRLVEAVSSVVTTPAEPLLIAVHRWSNKQLAHFILSDASVTFQAIRDVSKSMIEAYLVFLFDALGRQRPIIQPVVTEGPARQVQTSVVANSQSLRVIIRRIPFVLILFPTMGAIVAGILFLIQGGFGGGHGDFDAAIGLLLLPSILFVMHLPLPDGTPDIFIVLLPAALNLLLWVAIAFVLRAILNRKSSL